MKNLRYLVLFVCVTVGSNFFAFAGNTLEDPHERFNIEHVISNHIALTVIASKNVQATCDAESKKRGFGGFPMAVEACSFWDSSSINNKCTVVLPVVTNFHTVGHELRHCMLGQFHK